MSQFNLSSKKHLEIYLGLVQERFLVFDDLDGHVTGLLVVIGFDNLQRTIKKIMNLKHRNDLNYGHMNSGFI